ncbi:hypothetical protein P154DRAFT_530723 [Amniculicola lignicola CBS 123094]|uniref:Uncharacterized protein n=1 Tax=Amniculicola lignicola CBS 123094 TaxID=1392246 RepID=A0A6A5WVN6_9PLEO|nr:hypothetical protein P154DRAFT_530723 [Amniculicola lignicola CBS 123094]
MAADYMVERPNATNPLIPATAALDCLKSVPYDKEEDLKLIDELTYYINWQSNIAYMSDPPQGNSQDRMDVLEEIKNIRAKVEKDEYEDEYTIMFDLYMAVRKGYDFHFQFMPDILRVFTFNIGNIDTVMDDDFALVSVSTDGRVLPKLYNYYDIIRNETEGWLASPIIEINDTPAEQWVLDWSQTFPYLEDHARYNQMFESQTKRIQHNSGPLAHITGTNSFIYSYIPPGGNHTVFKHENGTLITYINNAAVHGNFESVIDGESFFDIFCNTSGLSPPSSGLKRHVRNLSPVQFTKRQESDFPVPEMVHSLGVIGGYYLTGNGYEDVVVISLPSFHPDSGKESGVELVEEFQNITGRILNEAVKAGKKKLVIDLRGNGGGYIFLGYDFFQQLFPKEDPYGATRFRANSAFDQIGKAFNAYIDTNNITYEEAINDFKTKDWTSEDNVAKYYHSMYNYRLPLDEDNNNFTSWEDFFGPHEHNNDKFTTPARYNLDNFFSDSLATDVTGYRTRATLLNQNQPFKAEDIILLQDGGCGSTCAIFSEFMKTQGNVQQVVIGGKPETGPMQGVAGSKGAQVLTFKEVYEEANLTYHSLQGTVSNLDSTELGKLVNSVRPLNRAAAAGINLRDNMRMNDDSGIPLEFIYEAADCRLFYSAEMIRDPVAVWKKTVDAHWGDAKATCVGGSTGHKSSLSGGATPGDSDGDGRDEKPEEAQETQKADKKKEGAASSFRVGGAIAGMVALAASFMIML